MTYGYIYKIQFPNGKHYIGLTTTSLEQRKGQHKCSAKQCNTNYLYNALRKYDMIDKFELIEIDTADTKEELCELEIGYILMYNSYMDENGYNMTYGGEGNIGYNHTEEDKQIMSKIKKIYFANPEIRKQQSKSQIKRFENPEERLKISETLKGRSPEWKIKHSDTKGQNKPFDVFTKDGTFVKTFCYQFEAKHYLQKEYHITTNIDISAVLLGCLKSSNGFVFKYK
jgi:predicted GIY-YIG superfamily endonuclease